MAVREQPLSAAHASTFRSKRRRVENESSSEKNKCLVNNLTLNMKSMRQLLNRIKPEHKSQAPIV